MIMPCSLKRPRNITSPANLTCAGILVASVVETAMRQLDTEIFHTFTYNRHKIIKSRAESCRTWPVTVLRVLRSTYKRKTALRASGSCVSNLSLQLRATARISKNLAVQCLVNLGVQCCCFCCFLHINRSGLNHTQ